LLHIIVKNARRFRMVEDVPSGDEVIGSCGRNEEAGSDEGWTLAALNSEKRYHMPQQAIGGGNERGVQAVVSVLHAVSA